MIDVNVRFFDLDALAVDERLLSDAERERVARKATATLRQRQAASFQSVRTTLGGVLGTAPERLVFHLPASGKPVLSDSALHFNASHSGGVGMLAWGARELGADVEALIARPTEGLAKEILSDEESGLWRGLEPDEQRPWLTRAWTRKESALKAVGSGLRIAPRTVQVMVPTLGAASHTWALLLEGRRWIGRDWCDGVPEGYRAAVCVEER